eukprot:1158656-Pelagomonas_calceolata.AAC.14
MSRTEQGLDRVTPEQGAESHYIVCREGSVVWISREGKAVMRSHGRECVDEQRRGCVYDQGREDLGNGQGRARKLISRKRNILLSKKKKAAISRAGSADHQVMSREGKAFMSWEGNALLLSRSFRPTDL